MLTIRLNRHIRCLSSQVLRSRKVGRYFSAEKERLDAIIKNSVEKEMSSFMPVQEKTDADDAVTR